MHITLLNNPFVTENSGGAHLLSRSTTWDLTRTATATNKHKVCELSLYSICVWKNLYVFKMIRAISQCLNDPQTL